MRFVTIRHFTEADIPLRSELLQESRFQANLTDFAVSTEDDALTAGQRRTIAEEHHVKRIFTLCGPKGQVLGFAWMTSIDWRSQTCELSFGVLPRFRGGLGAGVVAAAQEYLHTELNMRVVVHQVLEHNTMLQSAQRVATAGRVRGEFDSYTVGRWRTAVYWTETEEEARAAARLAADRRAAVAERIHARSRPAS